MEALTFRAAPLGACIICIEQLKTGKPGVRHRLPDGRMLIAAYCSHHESGFFAIASESGDVAGWTIKAGMPVEAWHDYITELPGNIAAGIQAMLDQAAERRAAMN